MWHVPFINFWYLQLEYFLQYWATVFPAYLMEGESKSLGLQTAAEDALRDQNDTIKKNKLMAIRNVADITQPFSKSLLYVFCYSARYVHCPGKTCWNWWWNGQLDNGSQTFSRRVCQTTSSTGFIEYWKEWRWQTKRSSLFSLTTWSWVPWNHPGIPNGMLLTPQLGTSYETGSFKQVTLKGIMDTAPGHDVTGIDMDPLYLENLLIVCECKAISLREGRA